MNPFLNLPRPVALFWSLLAAIGLTSYSSGAETNPHRLETATTALSISSPANRLVYQRDLADRASLPISGASGLSNGIVEARLVSVKNPGLATAWEPIATIDSAGGFKGHLLAVKGWYSLEIRAKTGGKIASTAAISRVGVGDVFVVVGHSVAQGGDINLRGAEEDRVNTISLGPEKDEPFRSYDRTGNPGFLPPAEGTQFGNGIRPAPFGHSTYFWAVFAEKVAQAQDVPVLILNAAFGGTSLAHWAKSSRGEAFEHSFVKSPIRMPYINLRNALTRYISLTGVRAILADQGQNDWPEMDEAKVFENYRAWINQARLDLNDSSLAIVVNRQTPFEDKRQIRRVQERVIREINECFPGPDYDFMGDRERTDRIHLNEEGAFVAAQLWSDSLTPDFFLKAKPFQPLWND